MAVSAFALIAVAGLWALAYHRAPLHLWTAGVAALIGLWSWWLAPSTPAVVIVGAAFVALAVVLNFRPLRRRWLSRPVMGAFRRALPSISQTERDALEAGTVGFEADLLRGAPGWRGLAHEPAAGLNENERAFLEGPVETLCGMLDDWTVTERRRDLPPEAWGFIKEHGFFGMIIPKAHGGMGFSAQAHSAVVMKLATRSLTAAVTVMVPSSLGPAKLLMEYGTPAQKDHYLPRLASGEEIPCFALTGPEAGSDAAALPDTGVVCHGEHEGTRVLGIRLNWEKRYITLGPVATVLGLAFRLYDPDHLLDERDEIGITLALIPTDTPGVETGRRHDPLGIPFHNGPNAGHDVFIPLEWVIGGRERVGQGWRMLMECLADGRGISLPALSTGAGKLAARTTGAYARVRRQFKLPIGRFEGVQEALARVAGHTYLMDAARVFTVATIDRGERPAVASAIIKYHLTERMREVINDAMDVHGGKGICLGPRNYLGRAYQALPISITVEGANILTRNLMIFGQGALRCHPYLLPEIGAAADPSPARGLARFDRALFAHLGYAIGGAARALFLGLTDGRLVFTPFEGRARRHAQRITRLSAALSLSADVALAVLGGALKRRERLSARLGDVLSQLYLAAAVLKRYRDQGAPAEDRPLLDWACGHAVFEAQGSLDAFLRNFPHRPAAWVLRALVFPLGRRYAAPGDTLEAEVAEAILTPGAVRDRLTAGIYQPRAAEEPLASLDEALTKTVAAEPIERRIRDAVREGTLPALDDEAQLLERAVTAGVIDEEEAIRVRTAAEARRKVIEVDAFSEQEYLRGGTVWRSNDQAQAAEPAAGGAAARSTS